MFSYVLLKNNGMVFGRYFVFFLLSKLLTGDERVVKFMDELSLMKDTTTKDVMRRFMWQIYILIVMMTFLRCCFIIALDMLDAIGYVIR